MCNQHLLKVSELHLKFIIFLYVYIFCFLGKKSNVQGLLNDLVPSGTLPNLPEGFADLSEMSTVSFTYNVHENNDVSVTSDMKDPMKLFNDKLEISNAMVEFSYNDKEKKGQKWQFKAQGNQTKQGFIKLLQSFSKLLGQTALKPILSFTP